MNTSIHFENGHGCVNLYKGHEEYVIGDLYVQPSERKRGYGTELLHSAISQFLYENLYAKGQLKLVMRAPRDSWMEEWLKRKGFQFYHGDAVDERYAWMILKDK